MDQVGKELMTWDESTKIGTLYYQGQAVLKLEFNSFEDANSAQRCVENIYKQGVKDGITAAQCAIDSIIHD